MRVRGVADVRDVRDVRGVIEGLGVVIGRVVGEVVFVFVEFEVVVVR